MPEKERRRKQQEGIYSERRALRGCLEEIRLVFCTGEGVIRKEESRYDREERIIHGARF